MERYQINNKINEDNLRYLCPKCGSDWITKLESLNTVQVLYRCEKCKIITSNKKYFEKKGLLNFDRRIINKID